MPDIVADGDNLGDHIATKSFKQIKGTDVASADAVTLGFGGNTFDITGTTTINHINNTNWVVGSVMILHFDGAVTLTNNAGGLTGSEANILLSGDTNFTSSAGDALSFVLHDSTNWVEISRNVPTSSYTAPVLGSTTLTSGATIPTLSDLTLTGITLDSTDSNIAEDLYTVGDVNVNGAGTLDVQSGGTMHIGTDPIKAIDPLTADVALNTAKTGITSGQASDITANNAKVSLDDNAVTLAKLAHGTADKVLGFDGSGNPAELTVAETPIWKMMVYG